MQVDRDALQYYPSIFFNDFWILHDDLIPLDETVTEIPMHISLGTISEWKCDLLLHMENTRVCLPPMASSEVTSILSPTRHSWDWPVLKKQLSIHSLQLDPGWSVQSACLCGQLACMISAADVIVSTLITSSLLAALYMKHSTIKSLLQRDVLSCNDIGMQVSCLGASRPVPFEYFPSA